MNLIAKVTTKTHVFCTGIVLLVSCFLYGQTDLEIVKSRMLADALDNAGFTAQVGVDFGQTGTYLSTIKSDGSWADVDYTDKDNAWSPSKHLDRMLCMAYSYKKDTSQLYKSASLLAALNKALGYWYQVNPTCTNWFKNDIAKQFRLGPIGLLVQNDINATYLAKIVNDLTDAPSMTGANKTALSTSVMYRAVIEGNATRLTSGVAGVTGEIVYTLGDGVQPDNSFQQHKGILYNGNYGWGFLRDVTWVGAMLANTQYAFNTSQIALLRGNYLDGTRWMLYRGLEDYNIRGRQVAVNGSNLDADIFIPIVDHFIALDPARKIDYLASKENILAETPQNVLGVRHYWNSDFTVVQRGTYYTSMKMCSKRTLGMEGDVNTENLLGYWLPYGCTYLYRNSTEFRGIFPAWDWARIPGVTAPHVELTLSGTTTQSTSFVGGVSDSSYGVSAMDFSQQSTTAKKSWFWFNQEWVALGAAIQSTHASPVYTSIQQSLLSGKVLVDNVDFAGGGKAFVNPRWVLHDSIGYVFPENQTIQVQAMAQSGSIQRIFGLGSSAPVSKDVFSIWMDHGVAPKGKNYSYIVIPCVGQAELDAYVKNDPIAILSNTNAMQAVSQKNQRITGISFYQAGQIAVPDGPSVKVDNPCLVLLNEPEGTVAISDPAGVSAKIVVTITNISSQVKSSTVSMPTGNNAGKSVTVSSILDPRKAITSVSPYNAKSKQLNTVYSKVYGKDLVVWSNLQIKSIKLINLAGRLVFSSKNANSRMSVSTTQFYSPGSVYLLRVETAQGFFAKTIMFP